LEEVLRGPIAPREPLSAVDAAMMQWHPAAPTVPTAAISPAKSDVDTSQSWLGSNARTAFKAFNNAVAEVRKGIGVDFIDRKLNDTFIGKGTKTQDQKFMEQVNGIPTNPSVNNTAGHVVGAAAPILGAALINPAVGVSVGAAQGSGSAQLEGEREGWTPAQTAGVALERGTFNAALSLIPGGAATSGGAKAVAVEGVKALAKTAAVNVGQAGIEAKLKGELGIKSEDEWHAMLHAAESGDQWAQAALFAGVHAAATALNRSPAPGTESPPAPAPAEAPAPARPGTPQHVASFGDEAAAADYARGIGGVAVPDATGRGFHVITMPAGADAPTVARVAPPPPPRPTPSTPAPAPRATATPESAVDTLIHDHGLDTPQAMRQMAGRLLDSETEADKQLGRELNAHGDSLQSVRGQTPNTYTSAQLAGMNAEQVRRAAGDVGVSFDAPATTIPRILDEQARRETGAMTNGELFRTVRQIIDDNGLKGVKAGSRQSNIDFLARWRSRGKEPAPAPQDAAAARTPPSSPDVPTSSAPLPPPAAPKMADLPPAADDTMTPRVQELPDGRAAAVPQRRGQNPPAPQPRAGPSGQAHAGAAVGGPSGRQAALRLADGTAHQVTYRAVEADDLIPSHDARQNFAPNPEGDENERPYHDPVQGSASRHTVHAIAHAPDPALLTTDTPTAVDGPPVTARTGQVLGGNARSMAMQLAYSRAGTAAQTVRQGMIDAASKFGLDPSAVAGLKNPVIVRELHKPGARGELSRALNESMTSGKTSATDAASRAARVSAGTATAISNMLAVGDGRSVRDVLADSRAAHDVVSRFIKDGVWTEADAIKYLNPRTHLLNEDGKTLIERTLLGRIVDDPTVLGSITPAVRSNLVGGLGEITRLAADLTTDIRPQVKDAVEAFNAWKRSGLSLSDYFFDQASLMPPPGFGDMQTALLVHGLDTRGPRQFKSALARFRDLWAPEKGGMFGDAAPVDRTRAMWDAFGKDLKGPGVVREAKALGLPVKEEPAAPKSLFGPGAAATNDPHFRRENPGSIPPPPDAPHTASGKESAKPPAARWVDRITSGLRQGLDSARRYTGKFLPTHSDLNPAAAAAAAEYMSAPEIASAHKAIAARRVLGEQPVGSTLDRLVNSVILEDGLRGDRAKFQEMQLEAQRKYDAAVKAVGEEKAFGHPLSADVKAAKIADLTSDYRKTIDDLGKHEEGVKSIIGDPTHELPTEEAYENAKADPEVQRALAAHRTYVMPESEAYYRQEAKIVDSVDVPVRGRDTNTYLTRKAIRPDESTGAAVNRPGTRERSSGLTQQAYGNAEQYANTYSENVAHQFDRQTLPALQAKYHQALIENGDAAYGPPGAAPRDTQTGQPWPGYEVKVRTHVLSADGEAPYIKPANQMIYVRPRLAKEFERVENIADRVQRGGWVKGFAGMANDIAMMSTAEPTAHILNHVAQLLKITVYPGENQGILSKIGVKEANLANVPIVGRALSILERVGPKLVQMAMHDPRVLDQELEAARVAGLQPESQVKGSPIGRAVGRLIAQPGLANNRVMQFIDPTAWVSKGVSAFTKASRLVALDAFHAAVEAGPAKDTPASKAQFLSQFTQYHHEAQPQFVSLARKTGLGPFASASQNFFIQRFKGLLGSPNFEATSKLQAVRARVVTAATAWAGLAAIGLANYAMWGAFKPKGTPAGSLVYGEDDKGRYKYLNVAQWAGARPAGVSQFTDAALDHATLQQAIDKGAAGLFQGALAPYEGPAVRALSVAATGKSFLGTYDEAGRVEPGSGETQIGRNVRTAMRELNPSIGTLTDDNPDTGPEKLLGAFAPRVGRDPNTVPDSQAEALAGQMAGLPMKNMPQTPDTKAKAALKADLLRQLRAEGANIDAADPFTRAAARMRSDDGTAGTAAVDKAVADRTLSKAEAAALAKKAGMGTLEWHLRSLSASDAATVYDVATLDEKTRIHDLVRDKIANSKLPPAQQDKLFADHGIDPPMNLDLRREYAALEEKRTADQQRKEKLATLVDKINAADSRQDWKAGDSLRRERNALGTQPKALAGNDLARFQRLSPFIERMNKVAKMMKEGILTKADGEKRLAELGDTARRLAI
jgi:hypothetical protein